MNLRCGLYVREQEVDAPAGRLQRLTEAATKTGAVANAPTHAKARRCTNSLRAQNSQRMR
jgi:hypothetical protein